MDITIDTSALIAVIANEPEKTKLIEITKKVTLIAPQSVHWEIGNAFSSWFKRKKATLEQTLIAIQAYQQIPLRLVDIDLVQALKLSHSHNIYAYDAYLIATALKYNTPLLSLDNRLITTAKEVKVKIIEV
jgi:predicted nucleic acid-binding protein